MNHFNSMILLKIIIYLLKKLISRSRTSMKVSNALFTKGDWTNPRENMEPIISEEISWTNPEKSAAPVGIGR